MNIPNNGNYQPITHQSPISSLLSRPHDHTHINGVNAGYQQSIFTNPAAGTLDTLNSQNDSHSQSILTPGSSEPSSSIPPTNETPASNQPSLSHILADDPGPFFDYHADPFSGLAPTHNDAERWNERRQRIINRLRSLLVSSHSSDGSDRPHNASNGSNNAPEFDVSTENRRQIQAYLRTNPNISPALRQLLSTLVDQPPPITSQQSPQGGRAEAEEQTATFPLAARVSQLDTLTLDREVVTLLAQQLKHAATYLCKEWVQRYLCEIELILSLLLFSQFEFQNKPSYSSRLQNLQYLSHATIKSAGFPYPRPQGLQTPTNRYTTSLAQRLGVIPALALISRVFSKVRPWILRSFTQFTTQKAVGSSVISPLAEAIHPGLETDIPSPLSPQPSKMSFSIPSAAESEGVNTISPISLSFPSTIGFRRIWSSFRNAVVTFSFRRSAHTLLALFYRTLSSIQRVLRTARPTNIVLFIRRILFYYIPSSARMLKFGFLKLCSAAPSSFQVLSSLPYTAFTQTQLVIGRSVQLTNSVLSSIFAHHHPSMRAQVHPIIEQPKGPVFGISYRIGMAMTLIVIPYLWNRWMSLVDPIWDEDVDLSRSSPVSSLPQQNTYLDAWDATYEEFCSTMATSKQSISHNIRRLVKPGESPQYQHDGTQRRREQHSKEQYTALYDYPLLFYHSFLRDISLCRYHLQSAFISSLSGVARGVNWALHQANVLLTWFYQHPYYYTMLKAHTISLNYIMRTASLVNYLLFLYTGKFPSLGHRILGLMFIPINAQESAGLLFDRLTERLTYSTLLDFLQLFSAFLVRVTAAITSTTSNTFLPIITPLVRSLQAQPLLVYASHLTSYYLGFSDTKPEVPSALKRWETTEGDDDDMEGTEAQASDTQGSGPADHASKLKHQAFSAACLQACPLCRSHSITSPCSAMCHHVYCYYCLTTLYQLHQPCIVCREPIDQVISVGALPVREAPEQLFKSYFAE